MTDLIERLRDLHRRYSGGVGDEAADGCDEAADELERLRRELAEEVDLARVLAEKLETERRGLGLELALHAETQLKLAEAKGLLREARNGLDYAYPAFDRLSASIDAFLTPSATP